MKFLFGSYSQIISRILFQFGPVLVDDCLYGIVVSTTSFWMVMHVINSQTTLSVSWTVRIETHEVYSLISLLLVSVRFV
jgi:hypothetical protein